MPPVADVGPDRVNVEAEPEVTVTLTEVATVTPPELTVIVVGVAP